MKKRVLAMFLAVTMALSLAACSKPADTPQKEEDPKVEAETEKPETGKKPKIGLVCWGYTDSESQTYQKWLDYAAETCDFDIEYAIGDGDEQIIAAAEILIQSGCDGIIVIEVSQPLMDLCAENGVYLALWASDIPDDDLRAYCEANPYWAACTPQTNEECYELFAEELYAAGGRNLMLIGTAGSPVHEARLAGVRKVVDKYDDFNIAVELVEPGVENRIAEASDNMLKMYPEVDCIISTQGSQGIGDAIIQSMVNNGKAGIPFATMNWDNTLKHMEEGNLYITNYNSPGVLLMLSVTLANFARGWEVEQPVKLPIVQKTTKDTAEFAEVKKYTDVLRDSPYHITVEDQQVISYNLNPDVTAQDFQDLIDIQSVKHWKETLVLE